MVVTVRAIGGNDSVHPQGTTNYHSDGSTTCAAKPSAAPQIYRLLYRTIGGTTDPTAIAVAPGSPIPPTSTPVAGGQAGSRSRVRAIATVVDRNRAVRLHSHVPCKVELHVDARN